MSRHLLDEPYYSVFRIAESLDVNVRAVRSWIHRGWLRAVRVGNAYRVAESELERFLQARFVRDLDPQKQTPRSFPSGYKQASPEGHQEREIPTQEE